MVAPIVQASLQAAVLSATSNILAQAVRSYRESSPFSLDLVSIFQFVLFALLNTPPNFLWQEYLEHTFPAKIEVAGTEQRSPPISSGSEKHDGLADGLDAQVTGRIHTKATTINRRQTTEKQRGTITAYDELRTTEKRLSVRNTLAKFALDQTVGAVFNTVVFIGAMAAFKGLPREQVMTKIQQDTLPLMTAGYKLWPLVSLLNFTVIPPNRRLVFGNLVGVAWGVFLSLFAGN